MRSSRNILLDDAPGTVAGTAGELARQGPTELHQHQVDGFGRHLQELRAERHRHEWTGEK